MARVVFHEHPSQGGTCLPGAFSAYLDRIPLDGHGDLEAVWQTVRRAPFERDFGRDGGGGGDGRCSPVQRSRIWPEAFNCWEATAHFVAAARRFLPESWTVHVWDRDLNNGARHVWPSLMTPRGEHLLVDLQTEAPQQYSGRIYSGAVASPAANAADAGDEEDDEVSAGDVGRGVLGGVHIVGDAALRLFGLEKGGRALEKLEGDALPEWARRYDDEDEPPPPPKKKPRKPRDEDEDEPPQNTRRRRPTDRSDEQRARSGPLDL
jgi:hypothetical protein